MKLIVGLGNPDKKYENTRHNMGFKIIDAFAQKHNASFDKEKFNGLYSEVFIKGEKVILLKPQSYMNLSGEVVSAFVNFYKISLSDILIILDDLDQDIGKVRLRSHGSCGGHNGLRNIELHLHTNEYKRLRIGISKDPLMDTADYVLGKFSKEDLNLLNENMQKYISILEDFLEISFDQLMSRYNSNK